VVKLPPLSELSDDPECFGVEACEDNRMQNSKYCDSVPSLNVDIVQAETTTGNRVNGEGKTH
jgi:hypothetical protein